MKKAFLFYIILFLASCTVQKPGTIVKQNDVERIIRTLSADNMQGRAIYTPGIEKAARFIENEFKQIGLQPLKGQDGFRQEMPRTRVKPGVLNVTINGKVTDENNVLVYTDKTDLNWSNTTGIETQYIKPGDDFIDKYLDITRNLDKSVIVFVDKEFSDVFKLFRNSAKQERVLESKGTAAVFIIGAENPSTYQINCTNKTEKEALFNIAGILPGKSKPDEYVIFSGHYDHLGYFNQ